MQVETKLILLAQMKSIKMLIYKYEIPLEKGKFLKRYKRFFVDILTENNEIITVHCANSGSMKSCLVEQSNAYVLNSNNPERKLQYSLELLKLEDGLACLNTSRANHFVNALFTKVINKIEDKNIIAANFPYNSFSKWKEFKKEAKFSKETRFDFCLSTNNLTNKCWVEVKSVSLKLDNETWAFPDAVTERGQKHLIELMHAVKQGDEAWLFFVLMRGSEIDPDKLRQGFRPAKEIDQKYAQLLQEAKNTGVKIALLIPGISLSGFSLRKFFILN